MCILFHEDAVGHRLTNNKVDGVVTSVLRSGFFVDCGSLQVFVGRSVKSPSDYLGSK